MIDIITIENLLCSLRSQLSLIVEDFEYHRLVLLLWKLRSFILSGYESDKMNDYMANIMSIINQIEYFKSDMPVISVETINQLKTLINK